MADIESNIGINIDTSNALASLQALQRQISAFQTSMSKSGEISNSRLRDMQQNLVNNINATGQFTASIQRVKTTTESFTQALEKNKLSLGQYFRYSMGATQTFGKAFRTEFDTIEKVARERVKTLQTQYIKLGRDASGAMQAIAVRPQVLDMKDLGTQTAIAAQKAQLLNQLMAQGSTNLLNFGKNTQWAGRQLMVGFTIPLGIMGAAAAKEFQKIEEQVLRLERVYGDFTTTMADTQQMTESIKGLAGEFTKYGVAVEKTIGLAAEAAAMGKTGADLTAQVAEANRLAVLGGVEQAQALETTISLTNAFGVSADKLSEKINFLNAVENQTVTSIQDMTAAIPIAAPVIQQLGGNIEDLTFFLTAMKEGGINANEGANALKSGLASLINPTGEAADMLAGFGINLQQIVQSNAGNVKGIVLEFAQALDTLDPLTRAQAIEQLFGKFQFSRMSTLFKNVIAEGTQASRVLDLTRSSAAELASLSQRELSKIEESPLTKYQAAIEQFKAAIAPIGEEFMKAVTPLINFGTQILESFNGWSDSAKQFAVIAVGAVGAIGPVLLMTFGLMANGLANIVKGVLFVRNGFKGLGGQSNVLAEQLSYMNSEQLQAAAVAGSLNQVHNSLIQTFTSEAGAVRNLAAAYGSAIAAQGAFMGGAMVGGARGGKGGAKKMARGGIVRGPGTGTSDSVPAMLSNGEAVIAADTVKRYPGLVSGLIAGEVRHLAESGVIGRGLTGGSSAVGQFGARGQYAAQASHFGMFAPSQMAETLREMNQFGEGLSDINMKVFTLGEALDDGTRQVTASTMSLADIAEHQGDILMGGQTAAGTTILESRERNQAYVAAGIAGAPFTLEDAVANGRLASEALASQSANSQRYSAQLQEMVMEGELAQQALQSSTSTQQRLDVMYRNTEKALTQAALADTSVKSAEEAREIAARRLATVQNEVAGLIAGGMDEELAVQQAKRNLTSLLLTSGTGEVAVGPTGTGGGSLRDVASGRGRSDLNRVFAPGENTTRKFAQGGRGTAAVAAIGYTAARRAGEAEVTALQKAFRTGVQDVLDINSPSREMEDVGRDAGRGLIRGTEEQIDEAKQAGAKLARNIVEPVSAAAARANTNPAFGVVAGGTPQVSANMQQYNEKLVSQAIAPYMAMSSQQRGLAQYGSPSLPAYPATRPGSKMLGSAQILRPVNLLNTALQGVTTTLKNAAVSAKNFGVNVATGVKQATISLGNAAKEMGTKVATGFTGIFAQQFDDEGRPVGSKAGRAVQKASGAAMGIGMAASMGGMVVGGEMGQLISNIGMGAMAAGGLSEIIMLLTKLPPQVSITIVALTALVGGVIALKSYVDGLNESAKKTSEALSSGSKKMDQFAEATGRTNPVDIYNQKLQEAKAGRDLDVGQDSFGTQFLQSDAGKEYFAGAQEAIDNLDATQAAKKIALQLGTAISLGLLTSQEAKSVADALAVELGNETFSIDILAQLSGIVTKDGKDITKDPVELIANVSAIQSESLDAIKNDFLKMSGDAGWFDFGGWEQRAQSEQQLVQYVSDRVDKERQMLAILDQQHTQKVAELQAAGDYKSAQEEIQKYEATRAAVLKESLLERKKLLEELNAADRASRYGEQGQYQTEKMKGIVGKSYDTALSRLESAGLEGKQLETAKGAIGDIKTGGALLGAGTATTLMATIDITNYDQFAELTEMFPPFEKGNAQVYDFVAKVSTSMGTEAAGSVAEVMSLFGGDANLAEDFITELKIDLDTTEGQQKLKDMTGTLAMLKKSLGDDFKIGDFVSKGGKPTDQLDKMHKAYTSIQKAIVKDGPIVLSTDVDIDWSGVKDMGALQSWFDSIPKEQQKFFLEYFLTVVGRISNKEVGEYMRAQGIRGEGREFAGARAQGARAQGGRAYTTAQYDKYRNVIAMNQAKQLTSDLAAAGYFSSGGGGGGGYSPPPSGGGGGGGGGGGATQEPEKPPTSFIDDVVSQIRKVVVAGQGMTENFQDSWTAIARLFGSGAPPIFSGIEQQLRNLGAGPDLIELVVGMSKEDWDSYKDQMFNFDAAGNITGLKIMAESIGRALNAVKLGEFNSEQQAAIRNASNQVIAIQKLVSVGSSYANAYAIVEDAAIAAAIAQETNIEKIRELLRLAQEAKRVTDIAGAAKSIADQGLEKANMSNTIAFLTQYNSSMTEAQKKSVLASKEIQTLISNFDKLTPDQLRLLDQALKDADLEAEVQLKIKRQTAEGMQELFNDGFNKAMEQFSAREQEIKIRFKAEKSPFQDIIDSATDTIENIRNAPGGLDDLEADLQRIQDQEIDINDKYKKRFAALDQIQKLNDRIAQQQRGQLSLAEALSQGDIAAAARAAEEIRSQDAAQALVDQREALQKSQELELENLLGQMGMTREQLEERIRQLKMQILEIEESQIEPAQYRITLLTREEELAISTLTVLGKTKEEWETIKNSIDLARVNTSVYNESIFYANSLVQELIDKWKEIEKPKETIHTIIERRVQEVTPAPTPTPTPVNTTPVVTTPTPVNTGPVKDEAYRNDMARRVIRGEFGNGQDRKNRLGADYQWIQDRVNDMVYHRNGYAKGGLVAAYLRGGGPVRIPALGPSVASSAPQDPPGEKEIEIGTFHKPFSYAGGMTRYANGGMVGQSRGLSPFRIGTDTVPAMLTPGEFVVKKWAVDQFGVKNLQAINDGKFGSSSVYNYNMSVNVRSDANPDEIARTVMAQIKRVDSQRIRGNRF